MLRLLRFCAVLCTVALMCSLLGVCAAAEYPSVSGECACTYIPALDALVYEKNATRRHPMASTTKIMTALVALENSCLTDEVIIDKKAVGVEGSSIYLQADEHQTV